jgi:peptidyl-prolyl cis-trans isomerase A (cyclophilin A)
MIQAGDPYLDGRTDVGFFVKDEFHSNLKHNKPGLLSMANQYPAKDTNSTQFFITLKAFEGKNTLDGVNTIFGEVIEGMDVVKSIGDVPINRLNDRPIKDVVIKSVTLIYE